MDHCRFSDDVKDGNLSDLLEKLYAMKQQLNEVKSLLSDKDIAEWNRFESIVLLIILIGEKGEHTSFKC